mmetsp:Transcript_33392/g.60824  ORF Transcript_33392/g.60824 Transcript_33392/m.60824 type:complete len:96 (-) Transcript_33392:107-394(-)
MSLSKLYAEFMKSFAAAHGNGTKAEIQKKGNDAWNLLKDGNKTNTPELEESVNSKIRFFKAIVAANKNKLITLWNRLPPFDFPLKRRFLYVILCL